MRPESGARMTKRLGMISGVPDSGAPSGHIALQRQTQG
jgi:hypothetical protein